MILNIQDILTDGIFETGAYGVPSKSQNPTVLGQDGPSSTQCSNPTWACRQHRPFGTNNYPPFGHSNKNLIRVLSFSNLYLDVSLFFQYEPENVPHTRCV